MIARVICRNNEVEAVVLGDEKRTAKVMKDLRDADMLRQGTFATLEVYTKMFQWYSHTVKVYR